MKIEVRRGPRLASRLLVQVLVVLLAHVRKAAGPDTRKGQQGSLLLGNELRGLSLALRTWKSLTAAPGARSPCGAHQCLRSCCLSLCHQNVIRVNYPPVAVVPSAASHPVRHRAGGIRLARSKNPSPGAPVALPNATGQWRGSGWGEAVGAPHAAPSLDIIMTQHEPSSPDTRVHIS